MKQQASEESASLAQVLLGTVGGLSFKLGMVSIAIVSAVVAASTAYAYRWQREQLLTSVHQAATTQARLAMTGLQFAMLENNRSLLHDFLVAYAGASEVERVFLTDATGNVAISSDAHWDAKRIALPEDICPTCPLPASPTRIEFNPEESTLRSLTPVANEAVCHRCHPAEQRTLGVLRVDFSTAPLEEARAAIVKRTVLWGFVVAGLLLLAEWAVVYLGALRRLQALRDTARTLLPSSNAAPSMDEIGAIADGIRSASAALHSSQQEIDRQHRFMIELLDKVDDGVAVLDRDRVIVAANSSYLRRAAATREAVAQRDLRCSDSTLCGQSTDECPTRKAFRTGRLEKRIHRRKDTDVYDEVFASPIVGIGGRVEFVVETWRDVTERLALQANLARSEQLAAVGTLATGFSHEISTPLGTVSTLIQGAHRALADRDRLEGPELAALRARLELATHEVFRCRDITRTLLDLGRKRRTARDRVDVGKVLRHMLDVIRPTAQHQATRLALELAPELPQILGRVDELEQVVLNLLMNALQAMPEGGDLSVVGRPSSTGLEIVVCDSGPGVAADDAERIFRPFFTRKPGGTGLGLYLSRQIVEAHEGRLFLDATGGPGARFTISLPSADARPAPSSPVDSAAPAS